MVYNCDLISITWITLFLVKVTTCLYFTQDTYRFSVKQKQSKVGRVIVLPNVTTSEECSANIRLTIKQRINDAHKFSINNTGWISSSITQYKKANYYVTIEAECVGGSVKETASTLVQVIPEDCDISKLSSRSTNYLKDIAGKLCFQDKHLRLHVEENNQRTSLGNLAGCLRHISNDKIVRRYRVSGSDVITVDDRSTEMRLSRSLDREVDKQHLDIEIQCDVIFLTPGKHLTFIEISTIHISIGDVNDNPPLFFDKKYSELNVDWKDLMKGNVGDEIVDKDLIDITRHNISVIEGHQFCRPLPVLCYPVRRHHADVCNCSHTACFIKINITSPEDFRSNVYCKIAVTDATFIPPPGVHADNRAILKIIFPSKKKKNTEPTVSSFYITTLSRSATKYAEVFHFKDHISDRKYAAAPNSNKAFSVTFSSGIVYVDDVDLLRKQPSQVNFTIKTSPQDITLIINIKDDSSVGIDICNVTCAKFMDSSSCNSACGLGSSTGRCQWRHGKEKSNYQFETCVSDLKTCPDRVCDDREKLNKLLCPQDCTTRTITGEGRLNYEHSPPTGIDWGSSPCWCNYAGECSCFRPLAYTKHNVASPLQLSTLRQETTKETITSIDQQKFGFTPKADAQRESIIACDWNCRTTIAASAGCVGALICLVILTWRLRKLRCHKGKPLKHVGSVASVSGIQSDYHEDRDYRIPSPIFSHKRPTEYSMLPEDSKWEFPREKLILDVTIGEGEFGRVVKAKAYGMDGKDGYKYVAVKMLKNCESGGEFQDLLSEFNLLKDIDHPNVVKLLGVCSRNGPFFVIVEFCEHGSLLQHLRNSRLEENGYINHKFRRHIRSQSDKDAGTEPEILNIRDLLSFAWQISKGMQYLSEIKLVHRDLAARNILVGSGKILKISDFGLTRDVYEADTYLKRSKGRIPVKWLAPESLYAQVYTTQSDVWSFGIVLWEIVTLGAPPYPGIPPERLYNLLIAGYRMDRPDGCSDELYAVMQKCWKADPTERPIFANLTAIFDGMLQQRTEYLELTGGFEDVDADLFERRSAVSNEFSSEKNSVLESKTSQSLAGLGNPYLTPASRNNLETPSRAVTYERRWEHGVQPCSTSRDSGIHNSSDSENMALLYECKTAVFSNSLDSEDEESVPFRQISV